ncbi:hypothetical protein FWG86_00295 [Candidatus Saccharibacteria bacterium]|nr:hypothetical protein [Candidatus Saccharibacteria bacterium]
MFTASMTGAATVTFVSNFTTNVVVSCSTGRPAGFQADLAFDDTLNVSATALNGATVTGSSRLIVETMGSGNGVNNGTSVLRLTVRNRSLRDGQTGNIRLNNVRGVCIDAQGTPLTYNAASITKAARYQRPAPQPERPPEEPEPEPDYSVMSARELLGLLTADLPAAQYSLIKEALARVINANEERINVLESQLAAYEEAPVLGEREEKTGLARVLDDKWTFFAVGAFMAALIAAAIAIIQSLVKSAEPKTPKKPRKAK